MNKEPLTSRGQSKIPVHLFIVVIVVMQSQLKVLSRVKRRLIWVSISHGRSVTPSRNTCQTVSAGFLYFWTGGRLVYLFS